MKWTIGGKLGAGFALTFVILILTTGLSNWTITRLLDTAAAVSKSQDILHVLDDVISLEKDAETGQRGYLLTGQERYLEPYTAALERIPQQLRAARLATAGNVAQQRRLDLLEAAVQAKEGELKETIRLRQTQGLDAALKVVQTDQGKMLMDDIRRIVGDMEAEEQAALDASRKQAEETTRSTRGLLLIGVLGAGFLVSLVAYLLARSTAGPVTLLLHAVQRLEGGDLRLERLAIHSNDEIGLLGTAFNNMLSSLRTLTRQTQAAAEDLTAATLAISSSTQQQAASLAQQLEAVHETTATMTEVSRAGAQIADKSRDVGASAELSSTSMASGLVAAQNTSRTMEGIREQVEVVAENIVALSDKTQAIGDIIATVNDLAERSNLLAFNAAIEAASVGEEGSRFSVVATELKNLADQSKASTVQVRSILSDIQKGIHSSVMLTEEAVKRVESGRAQADAAEQVMRQTADSSQSSVRAFQQIIAATHQQQIGFEQVTVAMQSIRTASEQNAGGISTLDTAAGNLKALSQQLRKAVERFQV